MTPEELEKAAHKALAADGKMALTLPKPWRKRPPKFPRGAFLQDVTPGRATYMFEAADILNWLSSVAKVTS